MSDLTAQIADLLADRAVLLGGLIGDLETAQRWAGRARSQAERIADMFEAWEDEREIADVLRNLATIEHGDHADPPTEWWRTPLGQMAARSLAGDPGARASTIAPVVAAELLGVSRQRILQLAAAGQLDRHPDGGVTRASVMARLGRAG